MGRPFLEKLAEQHGYKDETIDHSLLAPFDAGFGNAYAKRDVQMSQRIEVGPGLIVSKNTFAGSAMAPVLIDWEDLDVNSQDALRILREADSLKLQFQSRDTFWSSVDRFESFSDVSILPLGGRIGLIRRVGEVDSANCRLDIGWQDFRGGTTITLEVVATQDISAGEELRLAASKRASAEEFEHLRRELVEVGHPYNERLFSLYNEEL